MKICEKIRIQNYFFYKMEWIKNENILVALFNKALYIYKIIFNGLDDDFLKNFNKI